MQKKPISKKTRKVEVDDDEEVKVPVKKVASIGNKAKMQMPSKKYIPALSVPVQLAQKPISPKMSLEEVPFETRTSTPGETPDPSDPIQICLKAALKPVSLSSTRSQEIPCMIEISSPESNSTARSGIDIICVIDVSGSMSGDKLMLVKKTLLFMIKRLDVSDRVCLVTFSDDAKQLSGLVCMNEAGKVKLSTLVDRMHIEGGTEIIVGLEKSLSVLSLRQIPNQVTSVILLSDGVDNNTSTAMKRLETVLGNYNRKIPTGFAIHAFGYGSDHQADLMNQMSSKTSGGFYYVEKESTIPQAFSDCLGEMMSVIADTVHVELTTQPGSIPYSLTKVYSETGDLSFRMPPILAGDKKESVFIVNFLQTDSQVAPGHSEFPVKARVTYKLTVTGQVLQKEQILQVFIANESDNNEVELDENVMINFYRCKCAEVLKEAANFGDTNRLAEARNLLTAAVEEFKGCVVATSPTVQQLISDLQTAIPRFADRAVYEHGGKADLKSKMNNHYNKRGMYKNAMQKKLQHEAEEEFEEI